VRTGIHMSSSHMSSFTHVVFTHVVFLLRPFFLKSFQVAPVCFMSSPPPLPTPHTLHVPLYAYMHIARTRIQFNLSRQDSRRMPVSTSKNAFFEWLCYMSNVCVSRLKKIIGILFKNSVGFWLELTNLVPRHALEAPVGVCVCERECVRERELENLTHRHALEALVYVCVCVCV